MLKVKIPGMELGNPIIPASGTFGFGYEFANFYDINKLGTISLKGTTPEYRYGNELSRIAETKSGMINAIGLQNPGMDKVVNVELEKLRKVFNKKAIANIGGSSLEDYVICAQKLATSDMIGAIELNVSCPNVKCGGIQFGTNPEMLKEVVSAVKKVIDKPLYVKLSPNVTNIVEMAVAAESAGADAIVMINTLVGMRIDINKGTPVIANQIGGLSGPCIFPVALRMIFQVYQQVKIPIIGVGGITCARDVIEMMMAGATAVQVGSQNLVDPWACEKIIDELPEVLNELGYENINQIIGRVHG